MSEPRFEKRLLAPKHWPSWLMIGIVRLLVLLPLGVLDRVGSAIGYLAMRCMPRRARIVHTNLQLCFPEASAAELDRRVEAHFRSIGRGVFETGCAWWKPSRVMAPRMRVVGVEHLHAALRGGGVILMTGHFTTLEIGARALCEAGIPFHAMYKPSRDPVVDYLMRRLRSRHSRRPAIRRNSLRDLLRALRNGEAIWYAPDQTMSRDSVFVRFFGVPTQTITATAKLARAGRASVVPFFPRREAGGWVVQVLPAWEGFPSGDVEADARRVNAAIEKGVNLAPDDYFWIHRRFKFRPDGAPAVYDE